MRYTTILFDLDGTISDSFEGITKSVQYALNACGVPVPEQNELRQYIGPKLSDSFRDFAGLNEEQTVLAVKKYRERYNRIGVFENTIYDGMAELIKALKDNDAKIATASTKPAHFVEKILEMGSIKQYFDFIAGSELDGARSDKKELIEYALENLGDKKGGHVCIIGDRCYDGNGAKRCGIDFIGAGWGYGTFEELKNENPVVICSTVKELYDYLINGKK